MRALSLRQPWAFAVLHLGKRIENRVWGSKYRGPFLIHAASGCTEKEYQWAVSWMRNALGPLEVPPKDLLPRGGFVGRAVLQDVIPPFTERYPEGVDGRWHMTEQYGFVLGSVEAIPFVPYKASLRIFNVPECEACGGDGKKLWMHGGDDSCRHCNGTGVGAAHHGSHPIPSSHR